MSTAIKIVGTNGQISIGKEYAGKAVSIDQVSEGVWIIKSGEFIPDSERWLHEEKHLRKLNKALDWANKNPPKDNFESLAKKVNNHG